MAKLDLLLTQFGLEKLNPARFDIKQDAEDKPVGTSLLGTPVYSALEIKAGRYTTENGETVDFPGMFLGEVLMTVSMSKNIVTTQLQGRKGTVKEYISDGDYSINVKGLLSSPYARQYPQALVGDLVAICKAPVSLQVVSKFLQQFGIFEIVIQNYDFPQNQGTYNIQPFTLQCLSDEPLELQLQIEKADSATISTGQQFSATV